MKKNENIKEVSDLQDLVDLQGVSGFDTYKNDKYNPETNKIKSDQNNLDSRVGNDTNTSNSNTNDINDLGVVKVDKTKVIHHEGEEIYQTLLSEDKLVPFGANNTGFPQNVLLTGAYDLSNPDKMIFNGKNRNFFYSEDSGDSYENIEFSVLPDYIKNETFEFTGVASVNGSAIKAVAWYYENTYGRCMIFISKDFKNWKFDKLLYRTDSVNRVMIKGDRIFFKLGSSIYSWATEVHTGVWSRSINIENDPWIKHWSATAGGGTATHNIPLPVVNQYGADGIRFAQFFELNGKIYDILFYDRNNHYKAYPDPESYQIWIKPIDGNSVMTIDIGDRFGYIIAGSTIYRDGHLYILALNNNDSAQSEIFKINVSDWTLVSSIKPNLSGGHAEINEDGTYFYMKSGTYFKRVKYDGSVADTIPFVNESGVKIRVSSSFYLWKGDKYYIGTYGTDLRRFEYIGGQLVLEKTFNNPSPTVDIVFARENKEDNSIVIRDSLGNRRITSDNGKSWSNTVADPVLDIDHWEIPFDSDEGSFKKGERVEWAGMLIKHIDVDGSIKQSYTIPRQDIVIGDGSYWSINSKTIICVHVGKNGYMLVTFALRNNANTHSQVHSYFCKISDWGNSSFWETSSPVMTRSWTHFNGHFYYPQNFFDNYYKCLHTGTSGSILIDFRSLTAIARNGTYAERETDYPLGNLDFLINTSKFSGRMPGGNDVFVIKNDLTYVGLKFVNLPNEIVIQRNPKKIGSYFFYFYVNGMAYYAKEHDVSNAPETAFKELLTGVYGKLNDVEFNGAIWIAVGDKGSTRYSYDLENWFGYEITRYSTPQENDLGFDIVKELSTGETKSIDLFVQGASNIKFKDTGHIQATKTGHSEDILQLNSNGTIVSSNKMKLNEYGELIENGITRAYENIFYELIQMTSSVNYFGYIPYNWRGNYLIITGEVRNVSSGSDAFLKLKYNNGLDNIRAVETFQQNMGSAWKKFTSVVALPSEWNKAKYWGEDYKDPNKLDIQGMAISLDSNSLGWELRNINFDAGVRRRKAEFRTNARDGYLMPIPYSWRGRKVRFTYEVKNDGAVASSGVGIYYKNEYGNLVHSEGAFVTPAETADWKLVSFVIDLPVLWDMNRVWGSNVESFPYQEVQNIGLTFFIYNTAIHGSVANDGWLYRNIEIKVQHTENTFDKIKAAKLTFNDLKKYTFNEISSRQDVLYKD